MNTVIKFALGAIAGTVFGAEMMSYFDCKNFKEEITRLEYKHLDEMSDLHNAYSKVIMDMQDSCYMVRSCNQWSEVACKSLDLVYAIRKHDSIAFDEFISYGEFIDLQNYMDTTSLGCESLEAFIGRIRK